VTAMAMGEAAGTAAALGKPQELKGERVREVLKAAGGGPFTEK